MFSLRLASSSRSANGFALGGGPRWSRHLQGPLRFLPRQQHQARIPKRAEIATQDAGIGFSHHVLRRHDDPGLRAHARTKAEPLRVSHGKGISNWRRSEWPVCAPRPRRQFSHQATDWNGWGVEADNSRYQPKPGLSAADVPKLKLKWAFGFPGDRAAYAQPAVVGGRRFRRQRRRNGVFARCSHGMHLLGLQSGTGVRTAIVIASAKTGGRYVAYFGDLAEPTFTRWMRKLASCSGR